MGTETLIVFGTCGVVFLLIMVGSWCRTKRQVDRECTGVSRLHETVINGQRTFRIATVSRHEGLLSLDVYEIRLPRPSDPTSAATITLLPPSSSSLAARHNRIIAGGQPPPPFSTAINMPTPSSINDDVPTLYTNNCDQSRIPPPRYDEVVSISTISGYKVPEGSQPTVSPSATTI